MDFQLNLRDETVTNCCTTEPLCVAGSTSVRQVLRDLKEQNTGAALVCGEDGVLQGIFTERDALKLLASQQSLDAPVSQVSTNNPTTIASSTSVGEAISKMYQGGYRRLPVIDDAGKPVGLVKTSLLVHYLVEHFPEVVYNLPPDPHHVTQEREGA